MNIEKILENIDENRVIELTKELVSIPSVSGQEGKVAEFLFKEMKEMGFKSELQKVPGYEDRPNAIGILEGTDKNLRSLMLMGHTDIVPPSPDWTITEPFKPKLIDGRLYGHHHMKGGLASMIMATYAIKKADLKPRGDIILANVMGECDLYGLGTIEACKQHKTDAGICLEPSGGHYICIGHAGIMQFNINVEGIHAHQGMIADGAKRVNAIEKMAKIISRLDTSILTYKKKEGVLKGVPCVMVGKIEGGRHPAFAAASCKIDVDVRTVDGMTVESVKRDVENMIEKLKAEDPDLKASVDVWMPPRFYPRGPLNVSPEEPIVQAIKEAHKKIYGKDPGIGTDVWLRVFVTDAPHMNTMGIPTPIYGPGAGKSATSDVGGNAFIEVEEIVTCAKVIAVAAADFCSKRR